uniref:Reverse transcriptase domain-containing protein n=1 Tax=Latimeria chalumnae TaxID=7897 RepID=H3B2X3_LATCH
IQMYADKNDMKRFYEALRTVYGPQSSGTTPLMSADGSTLLNDKTQILDRWVDHFKNLLNCDSSIEEDEVIDQLPKCQTKEFLAEEPTLPETIKAIKLLSSGKAPGSKVIPAEVYKVGGIHLAQSLTELFRLMWRKETIPQAYKDASIIHLFKHKGSRYICDNHRGISLLVFAGKILVRIILNCFT